MAASPELRELIARALAEDLGAGDITSEAVIPAGGIAEASIWQKQPGILFGLEAAAEAFAQAGAEGFEPLAKEGEWRDNVPATVARVGGPPRALLAGERVALNLLGHLCGIATLTARFAKAIDGTGVQVLDTRKTMPGLRFLEKAAVLAGGGTNHRAGLYDAILIKDNHVAIAGGVAEAVRRARDAGPGIAIEVECGDLDQVREALALGAERILLDNMGPAELAQAVALVRESGAATELEASGGITLGNVAEIAATGVDFVSVGALTHSAPALDVSMQLSPRPATPAE